MLVQIIDVNDVSWYDKTVNEFSVNHSVNVRQSEIAELTIPHAACGEPGNTITEIDTTICEGQSFEGYSVSGIYQDTFLTQEGCDSIRILTLEVIPAITTNLYREVCLGESVEGYSQTGVYVDTFGLTSGCDSIRTLRLVVLTCEPVVYYDLDACRSYMSDGSIMDYSEFDPEYPNGLDCGDVSATILFREPPAENKHSCTPAWKDRSPCASVHSTPVRINPVTMRQQYWKLRSHRMQTPSSHLIRSSFLRKHPLPIHG
jgi:hypothetical protein